MLAQDAGEAGTDGIGPSAENVEQGTQVNDQFEQAVDGEDRQCDQ